MSESLDSWIHRQSVPGGWLVRCGLCGKRFKKVFQASMSNYAEAEDASAAWMVEHQRSPAHRAALRRFAEGPPEPTREDRLVAQLFERDVADDRTRLLWACRAAAKKAAKTT